MVKEKSSDTVYRQIRLQILSGELNDTEFIVERELAERFGISRTPVRDALGRLCQEGYILSYPRKGYMINRVSGSYLYQIQQIRFQLESLAIASIIREVSDDRLNAFEITSHGSVTNPYHTDNSQFHTRLAKLSGNQTLTDAIYQYLGSCSLAVFQHPDLVHNWTNFHEQILDAIKKRDFRLAQEYLARDLQLPASTPMESLYPL